MEVKLFKNGNIHIKFDQEFIKKLNIEVGRIKKWIHTPKEASEEINISEFKITDLDHKCIYIKSIMRSGFITIIDRHCALEIATIRRFLRAFIYLNFSIKEII